MMSSDEIVSSRSERLAGDCSSEVVLPLPFEEDLPCGVLGFGMRDWTDGAGSREGVAEALRTDFGNRCGVPEGLRVERRGVSKGRGEEYVRFRANGFEEPASLASRA